MRLTYVFYVRFTYVSCTVNVRCTFCCVVVVVVEIVVAIVAVVAEEIIVLVVEPVVRF